MRITGLELRGRLAIDSCGRQVDTATAGRSSYTGRTHSLPTRAGCEPFYLWHLQERGTMQHPVAFSMSCSQNYMLNVDGPEVSSCAFFHGTSLGHLLHSMELFILHAGRHCLPGHVKRLDQQSGRPSVQQPLHVQQSAQKLGCPPPHHAPDAPSVQSPGAIGGF